MSVLTEVTASSGVTWHVWAAQAMATPEPCDLGEGLVRIPELGNIGVEQEGSRRSLNKASAS